MARGKKYWMILVDGQPSTLCLEFRLRPSCKNESVTLYDDRNIAVNIINKNKDWENKHCPHRIKITEYKIKSCRLLEENHE